MDTVSRLRAMASLCRQTAAHHPDRSWRLLAEAEYWEHLAKDALRDHSCTSAFPLQAIRDDENTTQSARSMAFSVTFCSGRRDSQTSSRADSQTSSREYEQVSSRNRTYITKKLN